MINVLNLKLIVSSEVGKCYDYIANKFLSLPSYLDIAMTTHFVSFFIVAGVGQSLLSRKNRASFHKINVFEPEYQKFMYDNFNLRYQQIIFFCKNLKLMHRYPLLQLIHFI